MSSSELFLRCRWRGTLYICGVSSGLRQGTNRDMHACSCPSVTRASPADVLFLSNPNPFIHFLVLPLLPSTSNPITGIIPNQLTPSGSKQSSKLLLNPLRNVTSNPSKTVLRASMPLCSRLHKCQAVQGNVMSDPIQCDGSYTHIVEAT